MGIIILELNETNLHQLHTIDSSFTIDARLILDAKDGQISYSVEAIPPTTKRYGLDKINYSTYIRNPNKTAYLAYIDGQPTGQIILTKNWNRYAYIEDIAVDVNFRRKGIGRRLIKQAVAWAKIKGLPGIMLETQNNNFAACRLYEACGFHLGGFDSDLYWAIDSDTDEIALYWYLRLD